VLNPASLPDISGLLSISNLKDGHGRPIGGLGDGEIQWHSDQSYMLNPATGAMLHALELPPEGGKTSWADLCSAYMGLPDRLKCAVEGRRAIFDYTKRLAGYQGVDPHCQLKQPWYARRVGGAAARVGELLCSPIVLPRERGRKKALWARLS
jgi:alpha-ketoglutarate-dependent taurine dioxygenase